MERGFSNNLAAGLASTLDWWAEAGADTLVADTPRAWLKTPASPAEEPSPNVPSEVEGRPGRAENVEESLPDQLPLFREWLRTSDTLPYAAPAAPRVCPAGDPAAGLMILTAMPSAEDCQTGALVSGAAGRLFERMLAAIGRGRETVYLAGLSCLRAPGGRFDKAGAERCARIARHHVALAQPRALLVMGDDAAKALLGGSVAQTRGRTQRIEAGGRTIRAIATFHPDFLLAQPAAKARAWADLQLLMEALK